MSIDSRLVPLSAVTPQRIRWLWAGRIPLGALTLLEGDPGQGKSTVTYDLIARITRGKPMPGGNVTRSPAGVVLLQAEDDLARTIRPTLEAVGADLERVIAYDRAALASQPLTLPNDLSILEEAARESAARLIVIDPLAGFVGDGDLSNQRVQITLDRLASLACRADLAVLLVRHLRKAPAGSILHQGAGSMAIIGIVRAALRVVADPTSADPYQYVLALVKFNLADTESLAFRTVRLADESIGIEWLGPSPYSIQELLDHGREHRSAIQEALEVLTTLLAEGPLPSREVYRLAAEAGVSKRTLLRAKAQLGIPKDKRGNGPGASWWWSLPDGVMPTLPSPAVPEPVRRIRRIEQEQASQPRDEPW